MARWIFNTTHLIVVQGDLTQAKADAIVNAANSGLLGGGGVDGAIHRAAGAQLLTACQNIVAKIGALPPGQAVITPGFNLTARFIIHTVGPIWSGGDLGEEALLHSAYAQCLNLAQENALASIAFPAISCGTYGYPLRLAAPIALNALRVGLVQKQTQEAALWLHDNAAYEFWRTQAEALFGPPQIP